MGCRAKEQHLHLHYQTQNKMEVNRIDILLVEDTRSDAEITIRVLKKNTGVRSVQHLNNGLDALDYLNKKGMFSEDQTATPKAILLDLKMPKISGIECLKKIKENPHTQKIPVIIFTSSKE